MRHLLVFVLMCSVPSCASAQLSARDPLRQPFSPRSIWNMPVGSAARFVPAHFDTMSWMTADEDLFFVLKATDPLRPVFEPLRWDKRCGGEIPAFTNLPLPDDLIIPDAQPGHTPNNCAAFLMPDGHTLVQINPFTRCDPGGPAYGWMAPPEDLYGLGITGGHGGSGLSSIGGTIRLGELTSSEPIRHALKLNLYAKRFLWKFTAPDSGYLWPAWRHDGCAPECYGGTNPYLRMGSLLAIPPRVRMEDLHLETVPGKKLFWTLQNYGGYVADDTAWDVFAIAVESNDQQSVKKEFRTQYQMAIETQSGPWFQDCLKIYRSLAVVVNNSPTSVGGGGSPRQPLTSTIAP